MASESEPLSNSLATCVVTFKEKSQAAFAPTWALHATYVYQEWTKVLEAVDVD